MAPKVGTFRRTKLGWQGALAVLAVLSAGPACQVDEERVHDDEGGTLVGRLEIVIDEGPAGVRELPALILDDGRRVELDLSEVPGHHRWAARDVEVELARDDANRATAHSREVDGRLVPVSRAVRVSPPLGVAASYSFYGRPVRRVLVVPTDLPSGTAGRWTREYWKALVFGPGPRMPALGRDSIRQYFAHQSYGDVQLSGDVTPYVTWSGTSCSYDQVATDVRAAVLALGYDYAAYDSVLFFVRSDGCSSGIAGLGGPYARVSLGATWFNPANLASATTTTVALGSHELAHTMGIHHAGNLACSSGVPSNPTTCSNNSYGNGQSVMGGNYWYVGHLDDYHRGFMGWLPRQDQGDGSPAYGRFAISRSDAPHLLRTFGRGTGVGRIFLNYRQPGVDEQGHGFANDVYAGVSVQWADDVNGWGRTDLLMTNVNWGYTRSLTDGTSWVDAAARLRITQVSHDASAAIVHVEPTESPRCTVSWVCRNVACGEVASSCGTFDCGACTATSCGDSTCSGGESCSSCPTDCGSCGGTCGDGICEGSESCSTCSTDCGVCGCPGCPIP